MEKKKKTKVHDRAFYQLKGMKGGLTTAIRHGNKHFVNAVRNRKYRPVKKLSTAIPLIDNADRV